MAVDRVIGGVEIEPDLGGQPVALTERDLQEARALLKDPAITVEQVAKRLGVGRRLCIGICRGARAGV